MDKTQTTPYLDSISSQVMGNELSSLKENSMLFHVKKLCRGGRWYQYRMVPKRPNGRYKGSLSGSRATKRLSCSSTMTSTAVRQRRMRQAFSHQANVRLLASMIGRMLPMHSRRVRHNRFGRLSGRQNHSAQMALSKRRTSLR